MHLSKDKHILSNTILKVAVINACAEILGGLVRMILTKGSYSDKPDMLNKMVFGTGLSITCVAFLINVAVFALTQKKLKQYKNIFSSEDMEEVEKLQKQYNPTGISTLDIVTTENLLKIWAVILLGIALVYEITTIIYKNFINNLTNMVNISDPQVYEAYVNLYNQTHGFKYSGMLIAVIIGIMITGITLKDRFIRVVAAELMVMFMLAFIFFQQSSFVIGGRAIGIVWTSVIYHLIETVGLMVYALYLRKKYKGM